MIRWEFIAGLGPGLVDCSARTAGDRARNLDACGQVRKGFGPAGPCQVGGGPRVPEMHGC
jgi:hypothetical protein